ncbi:MAG: SWIM zinc finger family protein [Bryobacteraceae bacterium]
MRYDGWGFKPYVTVGERRRQAALAMQQRRKQGHPVSPVQIEGRKITTTFWGMAWCENLERYSDYANRLPRGRTYVRNGSVVDLQITKGEITASVMGSSLYTVTVAITPVKKTLWSALCTDCAGGIDSLVELLQGKLSKAVMERICRQHDGLFPSPREIKLSCSCPDWAGMCKHLAAVMYGIGARFDHQPELLFRLRGVDEMELIARAGAAAPLHTGAPGAERVLADDDLGALFGIDMASAEAPAKAPRARKTPAKKKTTKSKSKATKKRKSER